MFQHKKQFCYIGAKPRLCFHPYARLQLNCTARSGNMIYYSCGCVTPAAAAESLLATAAAQRERVYMCVREIGIQRKVNTEVVRERVVYGKRQQEICSICMCGQVWFLCMWGQ